MTQQPLPEKEEEKKVPEVETQEPVEPAGPLTDEELDDLFGTDVEEAPAEDKTPPGRKSG